MSDFKIKLEEKNLFKIILGLGNKSLEDIKRISALYAKSGADMFDLTPDENVFKAVYDGIKSQNLNPDDFAFCVSFAIADDKHGKKAYITQKKCVKCLKCIKQCPYGAIKFENDIVIVDEDRCIGCQKCNCSAIKYRSAKMDIEESLNTLKDYKIDCVELHISGTKTKEVIKAFKELKKINSDVQISICISRENYSDKKFVKLIKDLIELSGKNKLIIQADGISMTGGKDNYASTLQAVATAQLIKDLDVYLMLSGGCNSKTLELAKMCDIDINGVSIGSYGRLLISDEVNNPEFWYNKNVFDSALKKTKNLTTLLKVVD